MLLIFGDGCHSLSTRFSYLTKVSQSERMVGKHNDFEISSVFVVKYPEALKERCYSIGIVPFV